MSDTNDATVFPVVTPRLGTGSDGLDHVLEGLVPGDNVVWHIDTTAPIDLIERLFLDQSARDGRKCSYVTTQAVPGDLAPQLPPGTTIIDARPDSPIDQPASLERVLLTEASASDIHCTVINNLSDLIVRWGRDTVASFFARTCPQLFKLRAVAYWRISRGVDEASVIDDIRHITQCVLSITGKHIKIDKAEGRRQSIQNLVVRYDAVNGRLITSPAPTIYRLSLGLKRLRHARGWTQADLARAAGVSRSAISQAEAGRRGLSLDTLILLSERLGVSLDQLLLTSAELGYSVVRADHVELRSDGSRDLLDVPARGIRATSIVLTPGQEGSPPWQHRGVKFVYVTQGLVQLRVDADLPVLREGDCLVAEAASIVGWVNLLNRPAGILWVVRD